LSRLTRLFLLQRFEYVALVVLYLELPEKLEIFLAKGPEVEFPLSTANTQPLCFTGAEIKITDVDSGT